MFPDEYLERKQLVLTETAKKEISQFENHLSPARIRQQILRGAQVSHEYSMRWLIVILTSYSGAESSESRKPTAMEWTSLGRTDNNIIFHSFGKGEVCSCLNLLQLHRILICISAVFFHLLAAGLDRILAHFQSEAHGAVDGGRSGHVVVARGTLGQRIARLFILIAANWWERNSEIVAGEKIYGCTIMY